MGMTTSTARGPSGTGITATSTSTTTTGTTTSTTTTSTTTDWWWRQAAVVAKPSASPEAGGGKSSQSRPDPGIDPGPDCAQPSCFEYRICQRQCASISTPVCPRRTTI